MAGSIITIDQLTEQVTLAKADWIAVLNNTNKKSGKASFKTVIELLKSDFYTKTEILSLLQNSTAGEDFDWNRTITQGSYAGVKPGGTTLAEGLENLFFAALAPTCSISADKSTRQFGADITVNLHYNTNKTSNDIATIVVDGVEVTARQGDYQTTTLQNNNKTFYMHVTDTTGLTGSASTTVNYAHNRFWFTSADDLTQLDDETLSIYIRAKQGEFANGRAQTKLFQPANEYIYFFWLAAYGQGSFVTNGLADTDFIQKTVEFENSDDFSTDFILARKGTKLNNTFTIEVK